MNLTFGLELEEMNVFLGKCGNKRGFRDWDWGAFEACI